MGVRRRSTGVYSTLNYFYICDIIDQKCPKLRPYPSHELTEFLSEECSHPNQVISVERFNVDKCVNDPKLWVFDTKGFEYKNKPFSFGEPSLKVFQLKNDTLVRSRSIPSYLYDRNSLGIVQVIVHVINYDSSCDNTFAYIIDSTRGSLIVYSWKDDRFWRFDTPKFYGDAKYSDFSVRTPSGKEVRYFPKTHIYEATIDLCHNKLLYHARGSLSAYAIDLDTVNNANVSIIGPTEFVGTYVGEKNKRGQTGSQAMNNDLCIVWGIQEQNYAITCYNRQKVLSPGSVKIVMADSDRLSFLVDMKLEVEPKCCMKNKKSVMEDFKRYYSHHFSNNIIFVLTNNEKDIENGHFDREHENFGIYYIEENAALNAYPQCLANYKEEYQPPPIDKKPYMPLNVLKLDESDSLQEKNVEKYIETTENSNQSLFEIEDSYEIPEQLPTKQYQPPPLRYHKQYDDENDYKNLPQKRYTYEPHPNSHQPTYYNPSSYDPYYSSYYNSRLRTSNFDPTPY